MNYARVVSMVKEAGALYIRGRMFNHRCMVDFDCPWLETSYTLPVVGLTVKKIRDKVNEGLEIHEYCLARCICYLERQGYEIDGIIHAKEVIDDIIVIVYDEGTDKRQILEMGDVLLQLIEEV